MKNPDKYASVCPRESHAMLLVIALLHSILILGENYLKSNQTRPFEVNLPLYAFSLQTDTPTLRYIRVLCTTFFNTRTDSGSVFLRQ